MSSRSYVKSYKRRPRSSFKKASKRNPKLAAARYVANIRSSGFVGMEYKFYDTALTGMSVPNDGTAAGGEMAVDSPSALGCLNAPAAGSNAQQRDGWKISMKSIYVTGFVHPSGNLVSSATALDNSPIVYVALVLDTQTNGATLNSEDVFKCPGATVALAPCVLRNLEHSKRFRVLDKQVLSLGTNAAGGNAVALSEPGAAAFKLSSRSLPDVQFTADAAGVGSISDNSLHVIAYTNSSSVTITLSFNARLRFTG